MIMQVYWLKVSVNSYLNRRCLGWLFFQNSYYNYCPGHIASMFTLAGNSLKNLWYYPFENFTINFQNCLLLSYLHIQTNVQWHKLPDIFFGNYFQNQQVNLEILFSKALICLLTDWLHTYLHRCLSIRFGNATVLRLGSFERTEPLKRLHVVSSPPLEDSVNYILKFFINIFTNWKKISLYPLICTK